MIIRVDFADFMAAITIKGVNEPRQELNCVLFERFSGDVGNVISSNGVVLFVGKCEIPQIPGSKDSILLSFSGKPPSKFDYAEVRTNENLVYFMQKSPKNGAISKAGVAICSISNAIFPDWRKLLAKRCSKLGGIKLNSAHFSKVMQCAKRFNRDKSFSISFSGSGIFAKIDVSFESCFYIRGMEG
ncbi:hypothetical protein PHOOPHIGHTERS_48 [Serratia phage vB_SmaS_PhooPhighters]|nr:hypothetical protein PHOOPHIGHTERS_48 [Serratia phage vB_SmaS_PhooPhighters]